MVPSSTIFVTTRAGRTSFKASTIGMTQGSIFCVTPPGRKPIFSSTLTCGRVMMIRSERPCCQRRTAQWVASRVLPVPAGPIPNTAVAASSSSSST